MVIAMVIIAALLIATIFAGATTVSTGFAAIVERLGKYSQTLGPGFHVIIPFIDRVATKVPLRVQQHNITVTTKTKDNVFCTLEIAVQFRVDNQHIEDSYYRLSNPIEQIESYIQDAIRSSVPRLTLDEAFEKKDDIAHDVQSSIAEGMLSYGFIITSTLVVNIAPDKSVMDAMNAINAAQRNRAAAQELAEADRIKLVTAAKAKAEAAKLEGEGLADQRSAIIEGLGANMSELQAKGISNDQVMQLLLLTQYMNTVESIGTQAGNSTIFLPGGADSMNQLSTQLMSSLQANELTNRQRTAKPVPFNDRNHNGVPDELERNIPKNPLAR